MNEPSEYKGYRIATSTPNFWTAAIANYRVDRRDSQGWQRAHEGMVNGAFDSLDDAHSAARAAAQRWVDQRIK